MRIITYGLSCANTRSTETKWKIENKTDPNPDLLDPNNTKMSVPEPHWTQLDEDKKKECQKLCARFLTSISAISASVKFPSMCQHQRLHLIKSNKLICSYIISTGANGVGQKEGSGQTPLGLHVIASKFGDTASPFADF